VRSYKYLTTLCADCLKIQDATTDVPIQPPEQESGPEEKGAEEKGEEIRVRVIEHEGEPSFFQRLKSAFGGIFK